MFVLGGLMSGTRVCIGWYYERDSSMYWVVSILPLPFFYWILEMFIQCSKQIVFKVTRKYESLLHLAFLKVYPAKFYQVGDYRLSRAYT